MFCWKKKSKAKSHKKKLFILNSFTFSYIYKIQKTKNWHLFFFYLEKKKMVNLSFSSGQGKESYKRITLPGGSTVEFLKCTIEKAMKAGKVDQVLLLPSRTPIEHNEQLSQMNDSQKVDVIFSKYPISEVRQLLFFHFRFFSILFYFVDAFFFFCSTRFILFSFFFYSNYRLIEKLFNILHLKTVLFFLPVYLFVYLFIFFFTTLITTANLN